jgi:hypothetical protein
VGKETILDGKYRQIPAGWVSNEWAEIGTVRMIDGALHHATYRCQGHLRNWLGRRKDVETHWERIR